MLQSERSGHAVAAVVAPELTTSPPLVNSQATFASNVQAEPVIETGLEISLRSNKLIQTLANTS